MKTESLPFNWVTIVVSPIIGFLATVYTPLKRETGCFPVIYYFVSGIAITAGYHRLWSHKPYEATLPLKWFLAIFGAACCQWSIRTWAECHRSHHRYTDTDKDPYSVRHGLVHAGESCNRRSGLAQRISQTWTQIPW
ncbi:hypothetical protein AFLA_013243 [Aspergillus flavus NRRL3357]|nr:hypothetical protein AFLA_013243 [Aspergillus flavus NRRL3357]